MTKISIVGTGRVGSALVYTLLDNEKITELVLINRTKEKAKGLKADLMASFPEKGNTINVGNYEDANDSDIVLVTCGAFGAPSGSSLWDVNKPVIEDVFSKVKPKKDARIIIITTPCDRTARLVLNLTIVSGKNIIGFGGQLDVNRLKYLIYSDINDFDKKIDAYFVGEHGKRGIPIFNENISDKNKIISDTRNYFGIYLKEYGASTYGTAKELSKLVDALISENKSKLCISYYDDKNNLFVTWPCEINNQDIVPVKLDLGEKKQEFDDLIDTRKREEQS